MVKKCCYLSTKKMDHEEFAGKVGKVLMSRIVVKKLCKYFTSIRTSKRLRKKVFCADPTKGNRELWGMTTVPNTAVNWSAKLQQFYGDWWIAVTCTSLSFCCLTSLADRLDSAEQNGCMTLLTFDSFCSSSEQRATRLTPSSKIYIFINEHNSTSCRWLSTVLLSISLSRKSSTFSNY